MKLMEPQPPVDTAKIVQLSDSDFFNCMGFGDEAPDYDVLKSIYRSEGTNDKPVYKNGQWYWAESNA